VTSVSTRRRYTAEAAKAITEFLFSSDLGFGFRFTEGKEGKEPFPVRSHWRSWDIRSFGYVVLGPEVSLRIVHVPYALASPRVFTQFTCEGDVFPRCYLLAFYY